MAGKRSTLMSFSLQSWIQDSIGRFCPKTRFRKTLSVRKNTDKENGGSPWKTTEKNTSHAQNLLSFCEICVISKPLNLPRNHRNDNSKATTIKYKLSWTHSKNCAGFRASLFLLGQRIRPSSFLLPFEVYRPAILSTKWR